MNWEISWALCRACMDADSELYPLFDETSENDLSNNLSELAEIEINKTDGLPTKLCEQCILKIADYSKFKQLVRESDSKLRRMFIAEFPKSTLMKDESDVKIEDCIKNQINSQGNNEIKSPEKKQLENLMAIKGEEQDENQTDEQMEVKMIKYAESKIDVTEGCIFNNVDEGSIDNIEENSLQESNTIAKKVYEHDIDISCDANSTNSEQTSHDVLKSDMWQIVYSTGKFENIDEKNNSLQTIPFIINEKQLENKESISENAKRRKCLLKAKMKNKVDENIEHSAVTAKEANNNSDASDFDSCTDNADNIVGSLNDTITKVKEIRENGKDTYYQCTLCLHKYDVLLDALTHIVDWHVPVNGPFYCVICEMDCDNIKHLKNHVKIHKGKNPYICFICNKAYVMKRYLKRHMVCHTDFARHRCPKCGERFKVKTDLETHVKIHNEVAAFSCSQCSRVFNHKGNYKRHLISHLDPEGVHIPKYPCHICNKRFLNNRTLTNHLRVHTGERPFKCELCGKAFSQKGNLLNHAKVHTNPRSFTCEVCGKKFNQKATLKDHTKLHTGEKSYVCAVCGAAFTFSAALSRHMWSHADQKPFKCDVCDATFTGSYDLKRHMKTHNGLSKRKVKSKKVIEETINDITQDVSIIAQDNSDGNTIVIEQIFLCDNSIEIISQEESGKENGDSILCLL